MCMLHVCLETGYYIYLYIYSSIPKFLFLAQLCTIMVSVAFQLKSLAEYFKQTCFGK